MSSNTIREDLQQLSIHNVWFEGHAEPTHNLILKLCTWISRTKKDGIKHQTWYKIQ